MAALNLVPLLALLACFVNPHAAQDCGGSWTSLSGTIQSPNFPNDYNNSLSCVYVITVPDVYRVTLNFTAFDLQPSDSCLLDYVLVQDGGNENSPVLADLCSDEAPIVSRSFSNKVRITFVTDDSVTASGFSLTYTSFTGDDSFFLFASSPSATLPAAFIHRMDTVTASNIRIPMSLPLTNPIALDYDPVEGRIYWTEVGTFINGIFSARLDGSDGRVVLSTGRNSSLEGLAVDSLSRTIFYTDAGSDVIGMMTMSRLQHKTLIDSALSDPRGIALDTANGVMFWTDYGLFEKIERANYDGSERRAIVRFNLYIPSHLALDVPNNKLYWVDTGTERLESCDLNGNGRELLISAVDSHTYFGLALFENALYITEWGPGGSRTNRSRIIRHPLGPRKENTTVVGSIGRRLNGIHAYHQNSLMTGPNGCGSNNGGCSVFCIPLPGNQNKCMCPDGQDLSADMKSCVTRTTTSRPNTTPKEEDRTGSATSGEQSAEADKQDDDSGTNIPAIAGGVVGGVLLIVVIVVVVVVVVVKRKKATTYDRPVTGPRENDTSQISPYITLGHAGGELFAIDNTRSQPSAPVHGDAWNMEPNQLGHNSHIYAQAIECD